MLRTTIDPNAANDAVILLGDIPIHLAALVNRVIGIARFHAVDTDKTAGLFDVNVKQAHSSLPGSIAPGSPATKTAVG